MGLEDRIIRVPEALACAVSARLRDLCKFNGRRSFLVDEILGREPGKFFSFVDRRDIHNLLGTFVNWLTPAASPQRVSITMSHAVSATDLVHLSSRMMHSECCAPTQTQRVPYGSSPESFLGRANQLCMGNC